MLEPGAPAPPLAGVRVVRLVKAAMAVPRAKEAPGASPGEAVRVEALPPGTEGRPARLAGILVGEGASVEGVGVPVEKEALPAMAAVLAFASVVHSAAANARPVAVSIHALPAVQMPVRRPASVAIKATERASAASR